MPTPLTHATTGLKLPHVKRLCDRSAEEKASAQAADKESHARLRTLSSLPDNRGCAECTARITGWAVLPHGIFVCINCAQIHRSLGRHISRVKAYNTGTYLWYQDEVEAMAAMGNRKAALLYQGSEPTPGPAATAQLRERFVRDKYEHRRFIDCSFEYDAPDVSSSQDGSESLLAQVHRSSSSRCQRSTPSATGLRDGKQTQEKNTIIHAAWPAGWPQATSSHQRAGGGERATFARFWTTRKHSRIASVDYHHRWWYSLLTAPTSLEVSVLPERGGSHLSS